MVLGFEKPGGFSQGDLDSLGLVLLSWATASIMPSLSGEVLLGDVTLYDLSSESGPKSIATPVTPVTGGRSGQSLPNNVAVCITHYTAQRGRSGRGRSYVPGVSENDQGGNLIVSAVTTPLLAAFNTDLPAALPTGWEFVVISRWLSKVKRATGVAFPITSSSLRTSKVRTQRRRLGKDVS
jgi:hypothetical protein